jgi:hypothetical protein
MQKQKLLISCERQLLSKFCGSALKRLSGRKAFLISDLLFLADMIKGMKVKRAIQQEAAVLCNYLVGAPPTAHIQELYAAVINREEATLNRKDELVLRYVLRRPRHLIYLDSALALVRPTAALRQRLYAMFAITEATPEYAPRYLPESKPPLYAVVIGLTGLRAIYRTVIGLVLLHVVERGR